MISRKEKSMKRLISILCSVAMLATLCVFSIGSVIVANAAEENVVTVSTAEAFKNAINAFITSPEKTVIKLTDDIYLNPGYTFGFDDENQVPTVEYGGTKYYMSTGTKGTAGVFYSDAGMTTVADLGLTSFAPFEMTNVDNSLQLTIDGDGNTIEGFYSTQGAMFNTAYDLYVKNLRFGNGISFNQYDDGTNAVSHYVAVLVAQTFENTQLENCHNDGVTVVVSGISNNSSYIVGTIAAEVNSNSSVTGCTNSANVIANNVKAATMVGGVVGHLKGGTLTALTDAKVENSGNVTISGTTGNVGGIVGYITGGAKMSGAKNTGEVENKGTGYYTGGIVGYSEGSLTISDVENAAPVSSSAPYVGGIIGRSINSSLSNVNNSGNVTGATKVGGIAGQIVNANITDATNTGVVKNTKNIAGGIVGNFENGEMSDVENSGNVTGTEYVGGIAGQILNSTITNATNTNTGAVSGTTGQRVGGIVGYFENGAMSNVENSGNVTGKTHRVGGIAGKIKNADITNATNTGKINGGSGAHVGGIVGRALSDNGDDYEIYNVRNEGEVASSGAQVAGIVGQIKGPTDQDKGYWLINAVNVGKVTLGSQNVGGIVGEINGFGVVTKCENRGEVTTNASNLAGICGKLTPGSAGSTQAGSTISYCINTGTITNNSTKALSGILGYGVTDMLVTEGYKCIVFCNINTGALMHQDTSGNLVDVNAKHEGSGISSPICASQTGNPSVLFNKNYSYTSTDNEYKKLVNGVIAVEINKYIPTFGTADGHTYVQNAKPMSQTLGVDDVPTVDCRNVRDEVFEIEANGTVPEERAIVGKTFIGYIAADGTLYKAGANYDGLQTAVNAYGIKFYTKYGASVRVPTAEKTDLTYTGLRFTTIIDKADLDRLSGDTSTLFGTRILPTELLDGGDFKDYDGETILDVDNSGWYDQDDNTIYQYNGSIIKMKESNYDVDFSSASYINIEYADGTTEKIFAPYELKDGTLEAGNTAATREANSRSIVEVADKALNDLADNAGGKYTEEVDTTTDDYCIDKGYTGTKYSKYSTEMRKVMYNYIASTAVAA